MGKKQLVLLTMAPSFPGRPSNPSLPGRPWENQQSKGSVNPFIREMIEFLMSDQTILQVFQLLQVCLKSQFHQVDPLNFLKREVNSGYDLRSGIFWIIMSGLHLQEVQGDLGFQVAQVDPADPANQIINGITSIKNAHITV